MPEESGLVPPTTDEAIKEYFVNNLMNPKLDSHKQHYKYSQWIVGGNERSHLKQLDWIIEHFKKHGYTNKHCHIDIRDPEIKKVYDTPYMRCPSCGRYYNHGHTYCVSCKVKLYIDEYRRGSTPCLTGLTFRIIDNLLCLHINYRSWDLYSAWPENMGGFALLNQFVAEQLPGVSPGPLAFACIGADCHMSYLKLLKQRLRKE
jgi:thymidylate synthase